MTDGLVHNALVSRSQLAGLNDATFRWALSVTGGDPAMAEDVVHEAYVLILEGRARFKGASTLKTWLFGVVRNVARQQRRGQARQREIQ